MTWVLYTIYEAVEFVSQNVFMMLGACIIHHGGV